MLLQLSLCVVSLMKLASSQSIIIYQQGNVTYHGRTEQMLSEIHTNMSQLMTAVAKLHAGMSHLQTTINQLQKEQKDGKPAKKAANNETDCLASNFMYIASVNGCYKVATRNLNWTNAGLECQSLHEDAHLLVINDAAEQTAVADMIDSINETTLAGCQAHDRLPQWRGKYYWMAGQRIDPSRNTTFVWRVTSTDQFGYSTTLPMTYTNWRAGQPDYYGQAESCMLLMGSHSYAWNDGACQFAYCAVCELDL